MCRLCGSPLILIMIFAATTSVDGAPYCGNCIKQQPNLRNRPRNKLLAMDWDAHSGGIAFRRQGGGDTVPGQDQNLALSGDPNDPSNNGSPRKNGRKQCCPYDFDRNFCRVLDDRVLCGYNKNRGQPQSKDEVFKVTENCRIRGGRLECGYESSPYNGIRRPPAWDHEHYGRSPNEDRGGSKPVTTPGYPAPVTSCVEIDERIICKRIS